MRTKQTKKRGSICALSVLLAIVLAGGVALAQRAQEPSGETDREKKAATDREKRGSEPKRDKDAPAERPKAQQKIGVESTTVPPPGAKPVDRPTGVRPPAVPPRGGVDDAHRPPVLGPADWPRPVAGQARPQGMPPPRPERDRDAERVQRPQAPPAARGPGDERAKGIDLIAKTIWVNRKSLKPGEELYAVGAVFNEGNQIVRCVLVRLYLDDRPIGAHLFDMPPFGGAELSATARVEEAGGHTISVRIDPENTIPEQSKRNNALETGIQVEATPPVAAEPREEAPPRAEAEESRVECDLAVAELSVGNPSPVQGAGTQVKAAISNPSRHPARGVGVQFLLDGKPAGEAQTVDIPARSTVEVEARVGIEEGKHDIAVGVDPGRAVVDTNRENNTKEVLGVTVRVPTAPVQKEAHLEGEEAVPEVAQVLPGEITKVLQTGAPPAEGTYLSGAPDLLCSVDTTKGVYCGPGTGVDVTVANKGTLPNLLPFHVGVCPANDAKSSKSLKDWSGQVNWIGKTSAGIVDVKKSIVVTVPWQGPPPAAGVKYIAAVDLDNNIDEGGATKEANNLSSPFQYMVIKSAQAAVFPPGGPAIVVTTPAKDDVWSEADYTAGKCVVKWLKQGTMDSHVDLIMFRPGTGKPIVPTQGVTDCYFLAENVPNSGTFVAPGPKNLMLGYSGPWQIRAQTADGKVHGDSAVFHVREKVSLTIVIPEAADVWAPLTTRTVAWTMACKAGPADVTLIPQVAGNPPTYDDSKAMSISKAVSPNNKGKATCDWQVPGTLASGSYLLKVQSCETPLLCDTRVVSVQSKVSVLTAFLNPNLLDLAVVDVFSDGLSMPGFTVQCLVGDFNGNIRVYYTLTDPTKTYKLTSNSYTKSGSLDYSVNLKSGQAQQLWLYWEKNLLDFSLNQFHIPVCAAIQAQVSAFPIFPTSPQDYNLNNNTKNGFVHKTEQADVVAPHHISFYLPGNKQWAHLWKWSTTTIHQANLKWISNDTFEVKMAATVCNYGGAERTFKCYLYVDKQPGQFIQSVSLQPGGQGHWYEKIEKVVQIKVPNKTALHQVVFVADLDEKNNEPYPNSYMNNFVLTYFKLTSGGTLIGGP